MWLWEHHAIYARPAIASGWLRRARRALEDDTECVEYGNLLLREAETAHGAGELDEAPRSPPRRSSSVGGCAPRTSRPRPCRPRAGSSSTRAGSHDGMGHLDEAMLFAVEGRLRPFSTGKVYCSLIAACEEVGDFDRAAEWTEATLRWAEANHPFAIWPGICRVHRAVVLKRRGSLAEAEVEAARACEELGQSHVANSAAAYAEVGDIRRRLGELDDAEEAFARSQEISGGPCGGLALLRLAQGRVDAAMSIITGCVDGQSNRLARAGLLPMLVHVAVAADRARRGRATRYAQLEEIVDVVRHPDAPGHRAVDPRPPAAGPPRAGRGETLRAARSRAGRRSTSPTRRPPRGRCWARRSATAGDEAGATDSFAAAAALFEQIGARLDARLVYGDTKTALPAGLTEREVEVLRLIAAGLTNNEIAERAVT